MAVYVDADACPVKDEIITIALRHNCRVLMVCNGGIRPHPHPLIELVIVSTGLDEADKWIAEQIGEGDILVTSDIPLAAKAVEKCAHVLRPGGQLLSKDNIGNILATRDLMSDIRAADPFHTARSRPFTTSDKGVFKQRLDEILKAAVN